MSCCYFKKKRIIDSSYLEKNKNIEKPKQTEFLSEVLTCGTCKKLRVKNGSLFYVDVLG